MIKRLFANHWLLLLFTLLLFYVTQHVLNENIELSNASLKQLSNYVSENGLISLINNPLFWSSGLGNSLKIVIEVLLTSSFLYLSARLLNHSAKWKKYMSAVCISYSIFLLQYFVEFLYIKTHLSILTGTNLQNFSFLSLNHLLNSLSIPAPHYFEYASQTIGLFEVLYWFVLSWLLSKFTKYPLQSCIVVVLSGYVTVLLCWLLLISFFLLLNS
jgi:hypothetical protein